MVRILRKLTKIWEDVDIQRRDKGMKKKEWQKSYEGVKASLENIGLVLITSKEELDMMDVPRRYNGKQCFGDRKVVVSRNGKVGNPITIRCLLSGNSRLLTNEENDAVQDKKRERQIILQPKGVTNTINAESKAIDDLNTLIGISTVLRYEHLWECRRADVAYCLKDDSVFVPDQTKTSTVGTNGGIVFHSRNGVLCVKDMLAYLNAGMSLTCIGKNRECEIEVVWCFFGEHAIQVLSVFDGKQSFSQRLYLKKQSSNLFTIAVNNPMFRF